MRFDYFNLALERIRNIGIRSAEARTLNHLGLTLDSLGEKQKALDELEKHFDDANGWQKLNFEPFYENLRDEPRFKVLLKRAGFEK